MKYYQFIYSYIIYIVLKHKLLKKNHDLCLEFMVKYGYTVTELDLLQTSSKENQNESKKRKRFDE